jgi:hypothetical protein
VTLAFRRNHASAGSALAAPDGDISRPNVRHPPSSAAVAVANGPSVGAAVNAWQVPRRDEALASGLLSERIGATLASGLQLDDATHPQHIPRMKTAILLRVRVDHQLRADLEAVLREGETLSDFLETTVRHAVDYRRMQAEFAARAEGAWTRFQQTVDGVPAEEVVVRMRERLETRRCELRGKHRPTEA